MTPETPIDSASLGDSSRHVRLADLTRGLEGCPDPPREAGRVILLVRKAEGGRRETPTRTLLSPDFGIPGDAWGREAELDPGVQITAMQRDVAELIANGQPLTLSGDNLILDLDLSGPNLPAGSRVRAGAAVLEVTPQPHNGCKKFRARFGPDALAFVSMPALRHRNLRGIHFRVVEGGEAAVGDPVTVLSRGGDKPGSRD